MPDQGQNQVEGQEQPSTQESGMTEVSGSLLSRFEHEIQAVVERYRDQGLGHDEMFDALEEAKDNILEDPGDPEKDEDGEDEDGEDEDDAA